MHSLPKRYKPYLITFTDDSEFVLYDNIIIHKKGRFTVLCYVYDDNLSAYSDIPFEEYRSISHMRLELLYCRFQKNENDINNVHIIFLTGLHNDALVEKTLDDVFNFVNCLNFKNETIY
jgi:hypothetical protein